VNPVLDHELALHAQGLSKRYAAVQALDQLELRVPRGGVHAFLGPNGSGKTTTIRIATGLTRADHGTMHVFGRDVRTELRHVATQVGAIVEEPKFFPAFSGRLNLRLLALPLKLPDSAVDQALEQVGLRERAGTPVGGYSLGMKQRLALGAAMLKQPQLLIFDEPTNGLDPAGIQQIRGTLRELAAQGITLSLIHI
jgi:ABC-2 type transport system ATP-binding protein